jgi:DNA-binding transcriptional LysR family regulator
MDKLRSMEVFVAVVDLGSFTAAADKFAMSAVMVGKHIQALEERLGARLLARTTRRQSLTEIGAQYCEQCRAILAAVAQAETGAEAMRAAPRGRLRISAPVSYGAECLAIALTDYLLEYPDLSIDLDLNDRMIDLVEDGYDVAIRIGELDDHSNLVARRLADYRLTIAAAPAYLAKRGTPQKPMDLMQHDCLEFTHWSRHLRWRLSDGKEVIPLPPSRYRSNSGRALKNAALAGFGIIQQAEVMIAEDLASGALVPILQDYLPTPRPVHLLYPKDRQQTPKLRTFIEFVISRFA